MILVQEGTSAARNNGGGFRTATFRRDIPDNDIGLKRPKSNGVT
jgi:hypothetical protein